MRFRSILVAASLVVLGTACSSTDPAAVSTDGTTIPRSAATPVPATSGTIAPQLVSVFVVTDKVARSTTGDDAIKNGLIEIKDIPPEFVPANAIKNTQDISGRVALFSLEPGMVIVDGMFVDP